MLRKSRGIGTLILATIAWVLMWVVISFSADPYQLIIFLIFQSVFSALITLSWTELLVNSIPWYKRGKTIGKLSWWNGFGSIISTLASGYILAHYGFINFVFFISAIFGILAALNFLRVRITSPPYSVPQIGKAFLELKNNKDFLTLVGGKVFLHFAVGLAGPFLAVYVVTMLGGV